MAPLKDKKRRKKSKKQQLKEINNALQSLYARREEIDKDITEMEERRTELEKVLTSDDDDDAAAAAGGSVAGPSVQISILEKRRSKLEMTASGSVAGSSLKIHDNDDDKDVGGSVYGTSLLVHEEEEPVSVVGTRERRQVAYNVVPEKPGLDLRPTLCVSKKSNSPIDNPSTHIMDTDHSKLIRCIDFLPTHPEQFVTSDNAGCIQKWRLLDTWSCPQAKRMLAFDASHHRLFPYAISVNPFDDTLIAVYGSNEKLAVVSLREDYEEYQPVVHLLW